MYEMNLNVDMIWYIVEKCSNKNQGAVVDFVYVTQHKHHNSVIFVSNKV